MDVLITLIKDVLANWSHYADLANSFLLTAVTFLGAVVALATALAKVTPSPKDDEVVGKMTALVARLSVIKLKGSK
jgi:hypothetical protein